MSSTTGLIFDLDGTLVDSVYQHVIAWQAALASENIDLPLWQVHRKIGMSGRLFIKRVLHEAGLAFDEVLVQRLNKQHDQSYGELTRLSKPLPGSRALIAELRRAQIPWAIATSGGVAAIKNDLTALGIDLDLDVVITSDDVSGAKPGPDPFAAAAARLELQPESAMIVGDSIWDMIAAGRSRSVSMGLLSGGFSEAELVRSGAIRVFKDPADLLDHLDEVIARE